MKTRNIVTALATLGIAGAMVAAPVSSFADGWNSHRQQQKDQWKSIGVGAAAVGILGLLTHNDTLSVLGLGGAAYSGYRYSQDTGGDRYCYDNNYRNESAWNTSYPARGSYTYDIRYSNDRGRYDRNVNRWSSASSRRYR